MYEKPAVKCYGTFRDLTQLLGTAFNDGPSGDGPGSNPPRS